MDAKRFTGPQAGSQKYDLLTALAVAGLNGPPGLQTSMLRLIAVVTARYNWRQDELTVGQREMARLWSVDERTVKREIKRLTCAGLLLQLRPGVRGRVAAYRLNLAEIMRLSAPVWDRVGPDYAARMEGQGAAAPTAPANVVQVDFSAKPSAEAMTGASTPWDKVQARLAAAAPALHRNWFSALFLDALDGTVLTLSAPSGFVASYIRTHHMRPLTEAVQTEYPSVRRIEIRVSD